MYKKPDVLDHIFNPRGCTAAYNYSMDPIVTKSLSFSKRSNDTFRDTTYLSMFHLLPESATVS